MPASEARESGPDWEELYQERSTPWDKGRAAPPLLEWIDGNPATLGGRILVPGSGRGHDVRALAALSAVTEVIGLDLSPTAVAAARAVDGSGREHHLVGDLFHLGAGHHGTYDWVWEHTCFCAIDPGRRVDYVTAVHQCLKSGGHLLGVFYLDPYDDEHRPGGGPPHGCRLDELREHFESSGRFTIEETRVPGRSYPGREGREMVLRMRRRD